MPSAGDIPVAQMADERTDVDSRRLLSLGLLPSPPPLPPLLLTAALGPCSCVCGGCDGAHATDV